MGVVTDETFQALLLTAHKYSTNTNTVINANANAKNIRNMAASLTLNLSLAALSIAEFKSMIYNTDETLNSLLQLIFNQLSQENEVLEHVGKVLTALGALSYQGGSIIQNKIKSISSSGNGNGNGNGSGIVDVRTLMAILASNWPLVDFGLASVDQGQGQGHANNSNNSNNRNSAIAIAIATTVAEIRSMLC